MYDKLLFTDFHLKKERLVEQYEILKQIVNICINAKIKTVYFLGDMFNDRRYVTIFELNVFKSFRKKLKENNIQFIAIAGNHDKPNNESDISYLGIFENSKEDKIFEGRKFFRINNFGFVPYFPDNIIIDLVKNYEHKNKIEYIFMHCGFNGVKNNNGSVVESGLTLKTFKDYKNLKNIFVGHYHEKIDLYNGVVKYIGNSFQLNFGERDNKRIYLFNGIDLKPILLKYSKYKTYNLECNANDYKRAREIVLLEKDNYIRLNFVDDKQKLSSIPEELLRKISLCKELKIEKDFYDLKKPDDYQLNSNDSILKLFTEYALQENMNKEEKIFGLKILNQTTNEKNIYGDYE